MVTKPKPATEPSPDLLNASLSVVVQAFIDTYRVNRDEEYGAVARALAKVRLHPNRTPSTETVAYMGWYTGQEVIETPDVVFDLIDVGAGELRVEIIGRPHAVPDVGVKEPAAPSSELLDVTNWKPVTRDAYNEIQAQIAWVKVIMEADTDTKYGPGVDKPTKWVDMPVQKVQGVSQFVVRVMTYAYVKASDGEGYPYAAYEPYVLTLYQFESEGGLDNVVYFERQDVELLDAAEVS